jgi:flagellar biosynthesis chaperone FliJ
MNQNLEMLNEARKSLVDERRETARRIVMSANSGTLPSNFSSLQSAIDAIDRAIEDERALESQSIAGQGSHGVSSPMGDRSSHLRL